MHRLNVRALCAGPLLLLAFQAAEASLDFNTYAIVNQTSRVLVNGKYQDSTRISYNLTRLGSTSLEATSLTLTSHGSYLAVVEEATLTSNVETRPNNITRDFLMQGSLPVPPLAAVHSLAVYHGDTLYQAHLKKSVYSLDDQFFDTTALQATLDSRVAFLQQLGDNSYEATFSKLTLGEPVRIRIEYDIPFSGAPSASLTLPVLFHPSGQPPRQAQITFFEKASNMPVLQWLSDAGRVTLVDAGTQTVAYQSRFTFRRDENTKTVASLQATTFESGGFKGNYLLFKAGLNDSLMDELSRPLEVSFLWRWNPPYHFVETQNGLKTLSALGQTVVLEAATLKQIITELSPRGHRFGLFRSAPGQPDTLFPPSEYAGDGYHKLLAYLDQFTADRIYADYKDNPADKPDWVTTTWTDSGEIVKSRNAFLEVLSRIRNGFSARPEALKHIGMVGFGSAPSTLLDLNDPTALESILDSVTLSNVNAVWPGVNLPRCLQLKSSATLRPLSVNSPLAATLPPLLFPVYQPTSVEYRAFTPSRSHAIVLPFNKNAEREAVVKSSNAFDDTVELQGIDALGRKTRILTLTPRTIHVTQDSGMARLWAADPDRISEASEVDLGLRYGILTKGTYWSAGVGDGMTAGVTPGTVPGGNPIGIHALPKTVRAGARAGFRQAGGYLALTGLESFGPNASRALHSNPVLEVYDVRGKLILQLSLSAFRAGDGYSVPLELFRRLGQERLFIMLAGFRQVQPFVLNLGGR